MAEKLASGPYPIRAGFQRPTDTYPYYRWVPPYQFHDVVALVQSPNGTFENGRAYQVPRQGCRSCLQGLGTSTPAAAPPAETPFWMYVVIAGAIGAVGLYAIQSDGQYSKNGPVKMFGKNRRARRRR